MPDGTVKEGLEAFADGVTQAFRQLRSGDLRLPDGIFGICPADILAKSITTGWPGRTASPQPQ